MGCVLRLESQPEDRISLDAITEPPHGTSARDARRTTASSQFCTPRPPRTSPSSSSFPTTTRSCPAPSSPPAAEPPCPGMTRPITSRGQGPRGLLHCAAPTSSPSGAPELRGAGGTGGGRGCSCAQGSGPRDLPALAAKLSIPAGTNSPGGRTPATPHEQDLLVPLPKQNCELPQGDRLTPMSV